MAVQRIINKLANPIVSKMYKEEYSFKTKTDNELADFCLNHCPHAETPCDGVCAEIKAITKKARKQYGNKGLTEGEIKRDKGKTPFGRYLALLRRKKSETRDIMAFKLGCSISTLYKVERGTSPLPKKLPKRLVTVYGLSNEETHEMLSALQQSVNKGV